MSFQPNCLSAFIRLSQYFTKLFAIVGMKAVAERNEGRQDYGSLQKQR